jgi:hypothetical protein
VLLINEVVSNAVEHVGGQHAIEVEARWSGASLWVGVADGSAVRPIVREMSHTEYRGRGMRLVATIAHRWGAYDYRDGKQVWFKIVTSKTATSAPIPPPPSHGAGNRQPRWQESRRSRRAPDA